MYVYNSHPLAPCISELAERKKKNYPFRPQGPWDKLAERNADLTPQQRAAAPGEPSAGFPGSI
jgi:hypothetical protein